MPRHVGLPEAVQVEEAFGQTSGSRHVPAVAAVGQGVTAAQTEPVAEVQLGVCGQTDPLPAERGTGRETVNEVRRRFENVNNSKVKKEQRIKSKKSSLAIV